MGKTKPTKGQIVYSLNVGNAARNGAPRVLTPMIVKRVGTKKFYCVPVKYPEFRETAFFIDGWNEDAGGYCENHKLYETEKEWAGQNEINNICQFICDSFKYGGNQLGVTLPALRTIKGIIEGNKANG